MPADAPTPSLERKAILILGVAILFWGLGFPLTRAQTLLLEEVLGRPFGVLDSALLISMRFGLGALALWVLLPSARRRPTRPEWEQGLALGAVLAVGISIHTFGISQMPAGQAAFLTQFYVVLVPLYLAVRGRKWPSTWVMVAALLALAGIAILARVDRVGLQFDTGATLVLVAAAFFAVQILLMSVPRYQDNRAGTYTFVMCGVIGLFFIPVWPNPEAREFTGKLLASPPSVTMLVIQMATTVLIPFLMMNAYQRYLSPVRASLIYAAEPIPAQLSAAVLPGLMSLWLGIGYANEPLTLRLAVGGALLLLANVVIALRSEPGTSPSPA